MWVLCGQGLSTRALSIPKISDTLESDVISVLPAVPTLSGCDSTRKIEGKKTVLKVAERGLAESLSDSGKHPLSELQISNAEHLLVKCCNKKNKGYDI